MKVLYVINDIDFFISHRIELAIHASKQGDEVYVLGDKYPKLKYENIEFRIFSIQRASLNLLTNFRSVIQLNKIIKNISPDIVHSITLKSIILSNFALFFNKKINKINAVSGMGYLFTSNRKSALIFLIKQILKILNYFTTPFYIFQNSYDLNEFKKLGVRENYTLIKGCGVDPRVFPYHEPKQKDKVNITFTGRILKDKGVLDLIQALNKLPETIKSKIVLNLYGKIDLENPAHISETEINALLKSNFILWHGYSDNIKGVLVQSDIYCLLSYREGLPKSTIEAMAIGRPILTTNAPGCDDTVEEGVNGFKVEAGDVDAISKKLKELIEDKALRIKMGKKSRELFEKKFTLNKVIEQTFSFYNQILKK